MAKRGIQHRAKWQLMFLLQWVTCWVEMEEEAEELGASRVDFGIMQIEELQRTLEALKKKLEKSKN